MGVVDHWQSATLVASPSYPNSMAWSKENLLAVASAHIITILNPALLDGPRGLITLTQIKPFDIGVVDKQDLLSSCLMPICLSRDTRPSARSISWSQLGFAPNYGCLLAVCATDGRVKLYRPPFCEFRAEWVEVVDISDLLYEHLVKINFSEKDASKMSYDTEQVSSKYVGERKKDEQILNTNFSEDATEMLIGPEQLSTDDMTGKRKDAKLQESSTDRVLRHKRKRVLSKRAKECTEVFGEEYSFGENHNSRQQRVYSKNRDLAAPDVGEVSPCLEMVASKSSSNSEHISELEVAMYSDCVEESEEPDAFPVITPKQYASRSSLLSALIVAWSPLFHLHESQSAPFKRWQILAVGGKSGNIYFWKINEPKRYTIEHGKDFVEPILIGHLQAHNSWITSISWEDIPASSSKYHLFLATGSSDGSVKIWLGNFEASAHSSEVGNTASFSLLKELSANAAPVSIISLGVHEHYQDSIVIAVGRTSGSIEAWMYQISCGKTELAGLCHAHDQVVTGLTWAFGGDCLYSCSQDNSICSWILHEKRLCKVPFSSKFPSFKNYTDLTHVSDQMLGLAISPGQLMVAVVRTLDHNLLNQMYQARTQRAVVEFFWIGGQLLYEASQLNSTVDPSTGLSEQNLVFWESSLLFSLKKLDDCYEQLVLWDIIEALKAFKKCTPTFVEKLLYKWIASWFSDYEFSGSLEEGLDHIQSMLPMIDSRRIFLLNIICRRLMLSDVRPEMPNEEQKNCNEPNDMEGKIDIWHKLLLSNEYELRQRLAAFTLKAVLHNELSGDFSNDPCWFPSGATQIQSWACNNIELVHNQLKVLLTEFSKLENRILPATQNEIENQCCFCSAPVPFECPEFGVCIGSLLNSEKKGGHKLLRCAVSMQLCSVMTPMWFCICCKRSVSNLPPRTFFMITKSPLDVTYEHNSGNTSLIPQCPFCSILLQRSVPEFLLSTAPV